MRGRLIKTCTAACGRGCKDSKHPARAWSFVVDVGHDESGRRKQHWQGGFETRRDAEEALGKIAGDAREGNYVPPSRQTFGAFLDEWLEATRARVRPSTADSYRRNLLQHVIPALGAIPLQRVTAAALNAFYADMLSSGRKDGRGGLSPRTVQYSHAIIRKALSDAVRWRRVQRNVADLADPPKVQTPEMRTWSAEQLRAFLGHISSDRLYAAWLLAATTGMRRGELLGLKWEDVDFEQARVSVRRALISIGYRIQFSETKRRASKRLISLDPETLSALRSHRKVQLEEQLAWGPAYRQDGEGLLFRREDGSPVHPDRFTDTFEHHVKVAGLPRIRLHDLRHTWATLALQAGVHAKVVSERLGHANIRITLDTYSHAIPAMQEEAATKVAGLILGG